MQKDEYGNIEDISNRYNHVIGREFVSSKNISISENDFVDDFSLDDNYKRFMLSGDKYESYFDDIYVYFKVVE